MYLFSTPLSIENRTTLAGGAPYSIGSAYGRLYTKQGGEVSRNLGTDKIINAGCGMRKKYL
ncbi:hypothetical protein OBV_38070 [Oscillibacter valericigenes Sjm18-20]|nr:hypothetical protein OBV_38070 [Oscillibacter valericigenes Sjm18-20]